MELLAVASVQYAAHLCNVQCIASSDPEYVHAVKALNESWQNFLIFLREICMKVQEPENVRLCNKVETAERDKATGGSKAGL